MRIANPENQYGDKLLTEFDVIKTTYTITKHSNGQNVILTNDDVPNVVAYTVQKLYAVDDQRIELFAQEEQIGAGLLIKLVEEGDRVEDIDLIEITLVLKEQNNIVTSTTENAQDFFNTGTFVSNQDLLGHIVDKDMHFDKATRDKLELFFQKYVEAEAQNTPPSVAPEALTDEQVMAHFSKYAMSGHTVPPSRYYTRWVPNALNGNLASSFAGTAQESTSTMGYFPLRAEVGSTDTTKGQNNWWGKEWVGYWEYCNFIEAYGCKFPTSIKGDADFSWDKNVGVLMPALFYNICEEVIDGETTERYGYTIADSPFEQLMSADKENLIAHGINTLYRFPAATYYNPNKYGAGLGGYVERPYMVMGAFAGGWEDGKMVCKKDRPQYNNMSYNNYYNNVSKMGSGDGMRDSLVHIWEVLKYGTKHSQQNYSGLTSYGPTANTIQYTTSSPDYIVPVASIANFDRLVSVYLTTTSTSANNYPYTMTATRNLARVLSIETRSINVKNSDGTYSDVSTNCLVLDPNTVEPFYCCATEAEANTLQAEGKRAFCYVRGSEHALTGETLFVLDHDDGACYSKTNSRHPYRIQGMELLSGAYRLKANTCLMTGFTSATRPVITIDTVYNSSGKPIADNIESYDASNPSASTLTTETITGDSTTHQWVYCYLRHQTRSSTSSTTTANAYPAGCCAGLAADGSQVMQVTVEPVSGAMVITKMGTSNSQGHRDIRNYATANNYECLSGGGYVGASGGSCAWFGSYALTYAHWNYGAGL